MLVLLSRKFFEKRGFGGDLQCGLQPRKTMYNVAKITVKTRNFVDRKSAAIPLRTAALCAMYVFDCGDSFIGIRLRIQIPPLLMEK